MNCITPPIYKRRNPQDTVLYQVVQNTFLEWSGNYSLRHEEVLPDYVEKEFKDYFKCGILAHGFARAYCANCSGDFILAFSCKKRGVCPACNTKHMIFITLHLLEEVLPKLPLRQWVLSVPKWLRYHLTKDTPLASQVLRIFIDEYIGLSSAPRSGDTLAAENAVHEVPTQHTRNRVLSGVR